MIFTHKIEQTGLNIVYIATIPNHFPLLQETVSDGPVPWASSNSVCFVAEQVSHHPPSECLLFLSDYITQHNLLIVG